MRSAIVYVRQSTAYQVTNNLSQRRQHGLVERARQLGWSEVLRDRRRDLGRSGGGSERPGFKKLLAAICEGSVGSCPVDRSIEARPQRATGATPLEFCGVVNTLIIDEDGVYDPRSPNDRLLLGMKGTMSRDGAVGLPPALS